MRKYPKFFEYLNARGGTDEKGKVSLTGDVIDMPKPKAKDDPHKKNKKKGKHPQVSEYLNASGQLIDKPVVDIKGDYKGPDPTSPPGNSTPYRAANSGSKAKSNSESGLGDLGPSSLKYEPDTNTNTGGKIVASFPKTKTEQFIAETTNMSASKFAQYMLENHGCKHIDFIKSAKHVAQLTNNNESLMETLVYEVKSSGGIGNLLRSALMQPEAYAELQEMFGAKKAKTLRKMLNKQILEAVSPPIGPDAPKAKPGLDDEPDFEGDEDSPEICPHCGKNIKEPPADDLDGDDDDFGDEPTDKFGKDGGSKGFGGDPDFEDDKFGDEDDFEDDEFGDDEDDDFEDDEFGDDEDDDFEDDEFGDDEDDDFGGGHKGLDAPPNDLPNRKNKFGKMLDGAMNKFKRDF